MNRIILFLKISIIPGLLVIEFKFFQEYRGLIFLTFVLGLTFLWNKIYFFRYVLFGLIASILLIPFAGLLHNHHYDWNSIGRLPTLFPLADAVEQIITKTDKKNIETQLDSLFHKGHRKKNRFIIQYKNNTETLYFETSKKLVKGYVTSKTISSDSGKTTVKFMRRNPYFWEWSWKKPFEFNGTYFRYWRSLLKGEVLLHDPIKYTDYFFLHLILILLVINMYLHVNFRRNYLRSKFLMDSLKSLTEKNNSKNGQGVRSLF